MIGIVSGAGPLAGFDVARKIIEETVAVTDQEHLPVLVFSVPEEIPDRSSFLLGQIPDNPGHPIGELFLRLERAGATVAAIACNTAHADPIFDKVRSQLQAAGSALRVVNIIENTVNEIRARFDPSSTKVGVLGTDGTHKLRLYSDPLRAAGYTVLSPDDEEQKLVHGSICNVEYGVKACSSPVDPRAVRDLEEIMDSLIAQGADVIVLGCTELPLAITAGEYRGVPLIDANRLLARRLITDFAPGKLRPEEKMVEKNIQPKRQKS